MNATLLHSFNGKLIEFEMSENDLMVNATEMAKIFNKDIREFLTLKGTNRYINAKLEKLNNEGNYPHYNEDYLVKTNKKAGTLMLRPLALKFAAWLDPAFEVWVFDTIEKIIYQDYQEMKASNRKISELELKIELEKQKLEDHPAQIELELLEKKKKAEISFRNSLNRSQVSLFKEEHN